MLSACYSHSSYAYQLNRISHEYPDGRASAREQWSFAEHPLETRIPSAQSYRYSKEANFNPEAENEVIQLDLENQSPGIVQEGSRPIHVTNRRRQGSLERPGQSDQIERCRWDRPSRSWMAQ